MPDFGPLLWRVAPTVLCVLGFVGLIQFVVFVARRWRNS